MELCQLIKAKLTGHRISMMMINVRIDPAQYGSLLEEVDVEKIIISI
jgi:hypothetical protein